MLMWLVMTAMAACVFGLVGKCIVEFVKEMKR